MLHENKYGSLLEVVTWMKNKIEMIGIGGLGYEVGTTSGGTPEKIVFSSFCIPKKRCVRTFFKHVRNANKYSSLLKGMTWVTDKMEMIGIGGLGYKVGNKIEFTSTISMPWQVKGV